MKNWLLREMTLAAAIFTAAAAVAQPQGNSASPEIDGVTTLRNIASQSKCVQHKWDGRGFARSAYIEGMTLEFARAVCHPERPDVQVVSAPADNSPNSDDALAVYREKFKKLGMENDNAGVDTLRNSYVLLIGLGMMESSGKYCEGRDVGQCFVTADSAEAGLFQTSYGARRFSPVLSDLFRSYATDPRSCLLDVFRDSITCPVRKSHNPECPLADNGVAGIGPGADWQRLTKSCPAFAVEYGAVVLRKHGGLKGEFNPIRKQQAELRPECDSMLKDAQTYVGQHHEVCSVL